MDCRCCSAVDELFLRTIQVPAKLSTFTLPDRGGSDFPSSGSHGWSEGDPCLTLEVKDPAGDVRDPFSQGNGLLPY